MTDLSKEHRNGLYELSQGLKSLTFSKMKIVAEHVKIQHGRWVDGGVNYMELINDVADSLVDEFKPSGV